MAAFFYVISLYHSNCLVQTDIMDLLGSDLPVECDEGMQFAWSDGILLQVKNISIGPPSSLQLS